MIKALLFILLLTTTTSVFTQKFCDGFILYYPADSMKVKIKNKGILEEDIYKYGTGIEYKDSTGKRQIMRPLDCWGFTFFTGNGDTLKFRVAKAYDNYTFARQMYAGKIFSLFYYQPKEYRPSAGPSGRPLGYYQPEEKAYFLSLDDYNYFKVKGSKFRKDDKEALKELFKSDAAFLTILQNNAFFDGDVEKIISEYNLSH